MTDRPPTVRGVGIEAAEASPAPVAFVRTEMVEDLPAPKSTQGPVHWIRENLLSSWVNVILTLISLYIIWLVVPPFINFVFVNGVFSGEDRAVCATVAQGGIQPDGWFGGCWAYVGDYFGQFIYGRYPESEIWRVNLVGIMFFGGLIPMLIPTVPYKRENVIFLALVFPVLTFILLTGGHLELNGFLLPDAIMAPGMLRFWIDFLILTAVVVGIVMLIARGQDADPMPGIKVALAIMGGIGLILLLFAVDFGLEHVETERWGGLLVTLVIAVTGIAASLPLGIALALGRRSDLPIVKFLSVVFIEFWRGVPLITVLFMSSVMLPLFLPEGVTFDKLLRALIGVALFSAAYMAEVVRGGLQAIPKGQYEGAMALGLPYWQMMRMIVLPQALKLVIPGIVNTFIGLFKDTTLVLIIGLFDFLGQIQSSFTDPTWATPVQSLSAYIFAAFVFWFFCFAMSRYSIYMEHRLDTGHR
ncbi:MAG: amino acid ABC transporter permease [Rhizobiaceae bacterium]